MPTYTNNSNNIYVLEYETDSNNRIIKPSETKTTRAYYNFVNLNLDSGEPYETFIGSSDRVVIDDITGITLPTNGFDWIECDCTTAVKVYYNSTTTTPEYRPAGLFLINNTDNTASQITVKTVGGTGTLTYSVKRE